MPEFELVGKGLTVYEDDEGAEGPVKWLDSPQEVIDFVAEGDVENTIVLCRGGTTTFLTPALSAGCKGVMTLQGAPESHLGIVSREYGIPAIMGVAFEKGVRSSRGETIPADGAIVRLDISSSPEGRVFIEEGAPVDDGTGPEPAAGMSAEEMEAIGKLLANYLGETPHGDEGNQQMRAKQTTNALMLDDDASLRRELTDEEVDDLQAYSGWNMWDSLAARATEGESGLIPRQEYEAVGFVQGWNRYPDLFRTIIDEVGVDAVIEAGSVQRREVGTKANLLHIFGLGLAPAFGRGISVGLEQIGPQDRADDLRVAMQFMRQCYKGAWGGGEMLTSMRNYQAPLLDDEWIQRFADEAEALDDPAAVRQFQLFSAGTELLGFLLHFDNRLGLADTGPYPLGGNRFMVVRDHFLSDDVYHWADVAADLPHCITQAMIFEPDVDMTVQLYDISTLFTKPGNYLKHLKAVGIYARDKWNTPIGELRQIDAAGRADIRAKCEVAANALYRRISTMSRRDKVMAGAQVYYTEYILPFARLTGTWDKLKNEHDFFEIDPLTSEAYYPLVTGGKAATLVPELFLTGRGFPPLGQNGADTSEGETMADGFEQVGEGFVVFQDDEPVEGKVVWLDSPQAVIEFCAGDDVADSIVLARGGTTTFLTPALAAGVKGVLTLQGTPESHLGIVSREYGIPAIMGVQFSKGVRSSRGEVIPADGVTVRLDISTAPKGAVSVEEGAPVDDTPIVEDPELAAQMAEIGRLLESYRGEVPHGDEGNQIMRGRMTTDALELSPESLQRDLTDEELDDLLVYMGWEFWDFLALRATEGESGLIPRQEYEAVGTIQVYKRLPKYHRWLTEKLGIDGIIELGRTHQREIGSKVNLLHIWCSGFPPPFGRQIAVACGIENAEDGKEDIKDSIQFMRRMYAGAFGDGGPMVTSARQYSAPLLEDHWLERFKSERVSLQDEEDRRRFQRFSASTEMFGFLQHLDNRCGLCDTGPYPLEDGGFMIVRDHFINEKLYPWAAEAAGDLPFAVTQAMFFREAPELTLKLMDGSTLFTEPGNYLRYLNGAVVYARDEWDTPIDQIRKLDAAEMDAIQQKCEGAATGLYEKIAGWSERDKILNGANVYFTDFIAPIARAAGLWDELVEEFKHFDLDPMTEAAYIKLVDEGQAATIVPQLFIAGGAYEPIMGTKPDPNAIGPEALAEELPPLHELVLRGLVEEPATDVGPLVEAGLVVKTKRGYMLAQEGHDRHAVLIAAERATLDTDKLGTAYERFLAANQPFKDLCSKWQSAGDDEKFELLGDLEEIVERVQPALKRTIEVLPRFEPYLPRLEKALETASEDFDYVTSPRVDSVHTVWMEIHEDYLQTQGISREEEGSY